MNSVNVSDEFSSDRPYLYGAVSIGTIGTIWQFSRCDRQQQIITHDLNLYRVSNDLPELMGILGEEETKTTPITGAKFDSL